MVQGMETVVVTRNVGGGIKSYSRAGQEVRCPWIHSDVDIPCALWCPLCQEHEGCVFVYCGSSTRVFAVAGAEEVR